MINLKYYILNKNENWNHIIGISNINNCYDKKDKLYFHGYGFVSSKGKLMNPDNYGNYGKLYGIKCHTGYIIDMLVDLYCLKTLLMGTFWYYSLWRFLISQLKAKTVYKQEERKRICVNCTRIISINLWLYDYCFVNLFEKKCCVFPSCVKF